MNVIIYYWCYFYQEFSYLTGNFLFRFALPNCVLFVFFVLVRFCTTSTNQVVSFLYKLACLRFVCVYTDLSIFILYLMFVLSILFSSSTCFIYWSYHISSYYHIIFCIALLLCWVCHYYSSINIYALNLLFIITVVFFTMPWQ